MVTIARRHMLAAVGLAFAHRPRRKPRKPRVHPDVYADRY